MISKQALLQNNCILAWDGNKATTNVPKTITANGNVTQLTPFPGAGIAYFDGNGDYLTTPYTSDFSITGDCTFECKVKFTDVTLSFQSLFSLHAGTTTYFSFGLSGSGGASYGLTLNHYTGTHAWLYQGSTSGWSNNVWYTVAFVKSGSTWYLFRDGILLQSGSITSSNYSTLSIGATYYSGYTNYFNGYLSNVRFSNYARYTSNYTPPMSLLSNDSNTKLLLHFTRNDTTVIDSSSSAHAITVNGNVYQLTSPCKSGIAYFDGNGDYLDISSSSSFAFGTGNFTIRGLFFISTLQSRIQQLIDMRTADTDVAIDLAINASNLLVVYINGSTVITGSTTLVANTWYTITLVRTSGILKLYLNNTQEGSNYTDSNNYAAKPIRIGNHYLTTTYGHVGYISEVEVSNGISRSILNPTEPFIPDSYTKLLLHMDGIGQAFYDASDPPGDNGFSILPTGTTVTPNGTFTSVKTKDGSTIYNFDGSTNYITLSDNDAWYFGTMPMTICFYIYVNSLSAAGAVFAQGTDGNNMQGATVNTTGNISWYNYHTSAYQWNINTGNGSITTGAWYHITLIRNGASQVIYINGIQTGTTATSSAAVNNYTGVLSIGYRSVVSDIPLNGKIKNMMIFKKALTLDQIGKIYEETYTY